MLQGRAIIIEEAQAKPMGPRPREPEAMPDRHAPAASRALGLPAPVRPARAAPVPAVSLRVPVASAVRDRAVPVALRATSGRLAVPRAAASGPARPVTTAAARRARPAMPRVASALRRKNPRAQNPRNGSGATGAGMARRTKTERGGPRTAAMRQWGGGAGGDFAGYSRAGGVRGVEARPFSQAADRAPVAHEDPGHHSRADLFS